MFPGYTRPENISIVFYEYSDETRVFLVDGGNQDKPWMALMKDFHKSWQLIKPLPRAIFSRHHNRTNHTISTLELGLGNTPLLCLTLLYSLPRMHHFPGSYKLPVKIFILRMFGELKNQFMHYFTLFFCRGSWP